MKKYVSPVFFILTVISVLISCSPSPSSEKVKALDSINPEDRCIVFRYQAGENVEEVIEEIISDFNRENSFGITVKSDNQGFYEDIWAASVSSQERPDIVWFTADENGSLPGWDETEDLFPYLVHSGWGYEKDRRPGITGYLVKDPANGWLLPAVPVLHDPSLVFFNKDILLELGYEGFPETTDEFRKICQASGLLEDSGGLIYPPDSRTLLTMAYARGWKMIDGKGSPNEDESGLFSSGNLLFILNRSGSAVPALKRFEGQMEFSSGRYLFSMDSASGVVYYKGSIEASLEPFNWSVNIFPPADDDSTAGSWDRTAVILSKEAEDKLAGWIFLKHLLSGESQVKLAEITGTVPVNPEALDLLKEKWPVDTVYGKILEICGDVVFQPFPWFDETSVFYELVTETMLSDLGIDPEQRGQ